MNEWRGACIDAFVRAEAATTECLAVLAEVEGRGILVRLPHLVGQRLDALQAMIGVGCPFEGEGRPAATALERFREHDEFRSTLCHGVGNVTLDRRGCWTVVLRVAVLRTRRLARSVQLFTENEAELRRSIVAAASRDLRSRLGQVRASILRA
ncbi:hypothetical protein [Sphingomonas sp. CFBP 13706]|uniref:hypothetical protein n=1 Tax=Sphingomonas sp. CFBP 13706 TaxID=2775314 RepID=UPI0017863833|nr:hypothetical protein [Sphingomonas sp. CFBP 13706]MBD8736246.1 hypothetical protein [Sphingomonas sp. CFBP 13706]